MSLRRLSFALLSCACALGMGLALAACGGTSSANSPSAQEGAQEGDFVKFARCMREHGVNASSGQSGGPVKITGTGLSPQAMEAAQQACSRYRPTGTKENLTPQQRVEREEAVQKFAKCMREHGIHVEASTTGGAIRIGIHRKAGEGGPNPESPAFQAAQKACQGLLPFKAPGHGAAAGPGPSTQREDGGGQAPGAGLALGG